MSVAVFIGVAVNWPAFAQSRWRNTLRCKTGGFNVTMALQKWGDTLISEVVVIAVILVTNMEIALKMEKRAVAQMGWFSGTMVRCANGVTRPIDAISFAPLALKQESPLGLTRAFVKRWSINAPLSRRLDRRSIGVSDCS
jgi:hypothetical protein